MKKEKNYSLIKFVNYYNDNNADRINSSVSVFIYDIFAYLILIWTTLGQQSYEKPHRTTRAYILMIVYFFRFYGIFKRYEMFLWTCFLITHIPEKSTLSKKQHLPFLCRCCSQFSLYHSSSFIPFTCAAIKEISVTSTLPSPLTSA